MKTARLLIAAIFCLGASAALAHAQDDADDEIYDDYDPERDEIPKRSVEEVLAEAPAEHWLPIALSDLLVMDLADAPDGTKRRVTIQLLPSLFAQGHVANVKALAAANWWKDTVVYRVQKGFVAQFGGNPLGRQVPQNIPTPPESEYHFPGIAQRFAAETGALEQARAYRNEYEGKAIKSLSQMTFENLGAKVGFVAGWPVGMKGGKAYPLMCKGSLSPAHNAPPDTGKGAEISIMTGDNGRGLDLVFANVGRVIDGMEHILALDIGPGEQGFFDNVDMMARIERIVPASSLPIGEQPRYQYLASYSPWLLEYIEARGGYYQICGHPVPIRPAASQ